MHWTAPYGGAYNNHGSMHGPHDGMVGTWIHMAFEHIGIYQHAQCMLGTNGTAAFILMEPFACNMCR